MSVSWHCWPLDKAQYMTEEASPDPAPAHISLFTCLVHLPPTILKFFFPFLQGASYSPSQGLHIHLSLWSEVVFQLLASPDLTLPPFPSQLKCEILSLFWPLHLMSTSHTIILLCSNHHHLTLTPVSPDGLFVLWGQPHFIPSPLYCLYNASLNIFSNEWT